MRMYTRIFNSSREMDTFINEKKIKKENIVSVFQSQGGEFTIVYYDE